MLLRTIIFTRLLCVTSASPFVHQCTFDICYTWMHMKKERKFPGFLEFGGEGKQQDIINSSVLEVNGRHVNTQEFLKLRLL